MKALSLITSRRSQLHSFFSLLPSIFFFSFLPPQLKSKFSSHCGMDSVQSAKRPPSYTHFNPFSLSFFTFLCSLSISAPPLFSNTSCSFSCLSYFSVIRPSILPSFHPCVCPAPGQCERGPEGWHGSLAQAHKTPY